MVAQPMSRTPVHKMNCSWAQFAAVLGDKWSILILRDAFGGIKTFSEFEKRLGVAKNILSERLSQMVEKGILERRQSRPGIERYTYELTDRGKALFPVGVALMQWSDKWVFGSHGEPVKLTDKKSNAPIQAVNVISRDGRHLELEDIQWSPGPGAHRDQFTDS
jgi:DNA-binding HxlR family transcriptional regulator